jgi:hypothetical protein
MMLCCSRHQAFAQDVPIPEAVSALAVWSLMLMRRKLVRLVRAGLGITRGMLSRWPRLRLGAADSLCGVRERVDISQSRVRFITTEFWYGGERVELGEYCRFQRLVDVACGAPQDQRMRHVSNVGVIMRRDWLYLEKILIKR